VTRVTSFDGTLDTCVLYPITLCDTLLRFAEDGFYRPHWSQEILDELLRNLVSQSGLSQAAAQRRVEHMTTAFPEALVEGYQRFVPVMPNDPKDRHVLAAAVRSGSQIIVTGNLKHFPADILREFNIEAQSPDLFLLHQCNLDPRAAAAILRRQAADKSRPPRRTAEVLTRLVVNAPTFVHAMRLLMGLKAEGDLALPEKFTTLKAELAEVRARQRKAS
jgi:predicted nucleic acid-binding protein